MILVALLGCRFWEDANYVQSCPSRRDDYDSEAWNTCNACGGGWDSGYGPKPELYPVSADVSPDRATVPDVLTFTFKARNDGNVQVDGFEADLRLSPDDSQDPDDEIQVCRVQVDAILGRDDEVEVTESCKLPVGTPTDTYKFVVLLDPDDEIDEADEANRRSSTATVRVTGRPDLVIRDMEIAEADEEGKFKVTYQRGNEGGVDVPPGFHVQLVWSREPNLDAYNVNVCGFTTDETDAAGVVEGKNYTCDIPSLSAGDWYIGVIVDDRDEVDESYEDNNVAFTSEAWTL